MRCIACNNILTEEEDAATFPANPAVRIELCGRCISLSGIFAPVDELDYLDEMDEDEDERED